MSLPPFENCMQARVNVKMCLSMMVRVHTNSPPSYVSSLVTPCSSLQPRRALRSSSQADLFVTRSLKNFLKPCICICCTRLDVSGCRTLFTNLHHYRFVKLTSTHTCSKFTSRAVNVYTGTHLTEGWYLNGS